MNDLHGKTLFITGASRGIGLAIAKRAARDGANIVVAAKTTDANPKLPGTIHSAAAEFRVRGRPHRVVDLGDDLLDPERLRRELGGHDVAIVTLGQGDEDASGCGPGAPEDIYRKSVV